MIKSVEKDDKDFLNFCKKDVFGTRISAYYSCYSTDYDFVKFWVQLDGEQITAAISRIDGDVTVCTDGGCAVEIAEFLKIVGFRTIQCERSFCEKMGVESSLDGYVVEYVGNGYQPKKIKLKTDFELKEVYDIIKEEKLIGVGDYLPWLSDTTFRMNRSATMVLLEENSAGCAMCLFRTDSAALLGGVATRKEFRGRGIAGALVISLAQEEKSKCRRVELLCKNDSIVDFYKSIGFVVTNEWSIISETGIF